LNEPVCDDVKEKTDNKSSTIIPTIITICKCMLIALITSFIITSFLFQAVTVDGDSMLPTLHTKDRLILEKITYYFCEPKANDIVVIKPPNDPDKKYIKRIVAVGGDTVQIKDQKLYVNGVEKNELYIKEKMNGPYDKNFENCLTVPKNSFCVLGDNRNHSQDSRDKNISFVSLKNILGKVPLRIYPFNQSGFLKWV